MEEICAKQELGFFVAVFLFMYIVIVKDSCNTLAAVNDGVWAIFPPGLLLLLLGT